jgi:Mg2+ and Co2+ transporter CorA
MGKVSMDVRMVSPDGVESHPVGDLSALMNGERAGGKGFVWVDVPNPDHQQAALLGEVFGFHPMAVRDMVERNHTPKMHAYSDHVLVVLHEPELGKGGHVHFLELDQFIGPGYLVTVHGPINPVVPPEAALRETRTVLERLQNGRLRPKTPFDLSYAIVSGVTRHQEAFVNQLAQKTGLLESKVMAGEWGDPEEFLEALFRLGHQLLTIRTMATQGHAIFGRMLALARYVPPGAVTAVEDIVDQYDRLGRVTDGHREYLKGVIEFYKARTETKMTIAAERLAVIAVVTLPITALSSVYGMNIIVNDATDFPHLAVVLTVMAIMSGTLLTWAKRQGWW